MKFFYILLGPVNFFLLLLNNTFYLVKWVGFTDIMELGLYRLAKVRFNIRMCCEYYSGIDLCLNRLDLSSSAKTMDQHLIMVMRIALFFYQVRYWSFFRLNNLLFFNTIYIYVFFFSKHHLLIFTL